MPPKTLTIKESTYHTLSALKMEGESFSDLLDRLTARSGIEVLRRMRGMIDFEEGEAQEIIDEIRVRRQERRY